MGNQPDFVKEAKSLTNKSWKSLNLIMNFDDSFIINLTFCSRNRHRKTQKYS